MNQFLIRFIAFLFVAIGLFLFINQISNIVGIILWIVGFAIIIYANRKNKKK